ncbi:mitochondrial carrier protein [Scheffersomyces xylosifermentans]|uniref:mitochondrial carrier protein n=1 Tax=Scheffersomyces xylosifermentans TaxID=1304137 RepID=UPI00315D4928
MTERDHIRAVDQPTQEKLAIDFSDIVHGEDLEFRGTQKSSFEITHKIDLARVPSPALLSRCSTNQIITMAGAASGFLAGIVVCPLDVVKTRLQAQGAMAKNNSNMAIQYKGFLGAFKTILREEGIRGLYRGLVPITIGYLPTWTIYFTVYERAKKVYPSILYKYAGIERDSATHFISALTAGTASSIAVNPIWVVKTRLMIQIGKGQTIYDTMSGHSKGPKRTYYKGTLDALRTMYREEGIRVFYSGLVPSLFGLLHVGIHFPVYEQLKKIFHCDTDVKYTNSILWRLIIASSLSKMVASTITYPHEILRTRMQLQDTKNISQKHQKGRLASAIAKIYKKEGLKGFYAGYGINLARTVPASAVTLVSFEYFKTYLLEISHKV